MKAAFKKLGILIAIILGTLMLSLFVIAAFFEKEVSNLFLKELNKSLKTDLKVRDIDLSLISDFPNASIILKDVRLPGAFEGSGMLLEAEKLALQFGTMSIFSQNYKVNSIEIDDGALFVYLDDKGRNSADILKSTKKNGKEESADFAISLQQASLIDIEIIYVNELKKTELALRVDNAELDGEFSSKQFSLNSYASLYSGFLDTPEGRFMAGTELGYQAKVDVNLTTGEYKFDEVELEIEDNTFKVDGKVVQHEKHADVNLKLKSKDCSIKSVIGILPPKYKTQLSDFNSQGTFFLNADVNGKYSASKTPTVDVKFGLKNGKITSPRLDYPLRDVTFNAAYKNGKDGNNKDGLFEISDFRALLKKEPLKLSIKANDLDNPFVNFKFSGKVPLDAIYGLFEKQQIADGDGLVDFKDLDISGYYKYMTNPKLIYKVDASGDIHFKDVMLQMNKEKIYLNSGRLGMVNNDFKVENCKFSGAKSELTFNGTAKNLIPVLLSDSINSKEAKLQFTLDLDAKKLDFDQLFKLGNLYGTSEEAASNDSDEAEKERFTNFLDGTFVAKIDEFTYRKIVGKDFRGRIAIRDQKLGIKGVRVDAMNGIINLDGKVHLTDTPWLEAKIKCHQIDAKKAFYQCENFGQEVLEDSNIKGKLDAKVLVKAYWNEKGEFLDNKLYTIADVTLDKGELINFEMLESLSKYVKLKDLQHVKFTKTRNQFGILRGIFYIPSMFLQSNALNLSLSGSHRIKTDGKMDYLVKVNAGQVLWNKFKKYNPKKKPKKSRKKGFWNIYCNVSGNLDDYEYKYGKKNYKSLNQKMSGHFDRIRRDIKNELGENALFEPIDWTDDGEKLPKRKAAPSPKPKPEKAPEVVTPQPTPTPEKQPETPVEKIDEALKNIFGKPAKPDPVKVEVPDEEIPDEEYDPDLDEEID